MKTQIRKSVTFAVFVTVLLAFSFAVMLATSSLAKGFATYSSDDDKKDEKSVTRSSGSSKPSSEANTGQSASKPTNTYTPPPSTSHIKRNDGATDSGQRYSNQRNDSNKRTLTPPSGANRSNTPGAKVRTDNPYNYRQPGSVDQRTKIGAGETTRQPNVRDDRSTWTKSGDGGNAPGTANDAGTKVDSPYSNRPPVSAKPRDDRTGVERYGNDSSKNRGGIISNRPIVTDTRAKDDRNGRGGNRQINPRDLPTTRNVDNTNFRVPNDPRKDYRKEYENIGNTWHQRSERRDSHHEHDRDRNHRTSINIIFNTPIFTHYCFDYRPLYSYPSAYCYYYDYFPPYIYGDRVFYDEPFGHRVRYNEITVFMDYRDNYYASDPSRRALNTALADIEQAWEQRDIDRFMMYVRPRSSIAIFMKGDYAYSLDWLDYSDMTHDAMNSIDTKSFEFERLTRRQKTGEMTAYGRHKFYDWDGSLDTVYVRYTFERVSGEWYITEAETSDYKNW